MEYIKEKNRVLAMDHGNVIGEVTFPEQATCL